MRHTLRQELDKHRLLLISLVISFILLMIFLIFQNYELKILSLETKWLLLSGIPILIGLFVGGYIKNFKGLGLEFEYNLKEPIPWTVISRINMDESPGLLKGTIPQLNQLSPIQKDKINRLRFTFKKAHNYDSIAIDKHFADLKNLEFIEVVDTKGEFKFVIPASWLKENAAPEYSINIDRVATFVNDIEHEIFNNLILFSVTDYILSSDSTIDAYRKIKMSSQADRLFPDKRVLPVLNDKKEMIGTVDRQKLESHIAEEVEKRIPYQTKN